MPTELKYDLIVSQAAPEVSTEAISFETGATPAQVRDPSYYAYEHHGEGFQTSAPGALQRFYEDLILGRAFPLRFETRALADIDTLLAVVLFMHRDLAIHPAMPALVAAVDASHRLGVAYSSHLDPGLGRFLLLLRAYVSPVPTVGKRDTANRLAVALGWVRTYVLEGSLPHLGSAPGVPRILERGTNGFVLAQANNGSLLEAWIELYRLGHLRGVVVTPDKDGRRHVLVARKSRYLPFDLTRAAHHLNEVEKALDPAHVWRAEDLWLHGPEGGSAIRVTDIVKILLMV